MYNVMTTCRTKCYILQTVFLMYRIKMYRCAQRIAYMLILCLGFLYLFFFNSASGGHARQYYCTWSSRTRVCAPVEGGNERDCIW